MSFSKRRLVTAAPPRRNALLTIGRFHAAVAVAPNLLFPARALDFDSLAQFARAVTACLLAAAGGGFLDGLFDRFPGFAGALLNRPSSSSCLPSTHWRSSSVSLAHFCFSLPLVIFQSPLISSVFILLCFVFVLNRRQRDSKSIPAVGLSARLRQRLALSAMPNAPRQTEHDRFSCWTKGNSFVGNEALSPAKAASEGDKPPEFPLARERQHARLSRAPWPSMQA